MATTRGVVLSCGSSEPSSSDLTLLSCRFEEEEDDAGNDHDEDHGDEEEEDDDDDDDDEITEVFDSDHNEIKDVVDSGHFVAGSPAERSYSVGARESAGELRKRFRNWSGTRTASATVSPRASRHRPKSVQSPEEEEEEEEVAAATSTEDLFLQQQQQPAVAASAERRTRLQSMHCCPSGHAKFSASASCGACQLMHSSLSNYDSFTQMHASPTNQPVDSLVCKTMAPVGRSLSSSATPHRNPLGNTNKVEAEAEHLREIEGQDYLMMEGKFARMNELSWD